MDDIHFQNHIVVHKVRQGILVGYDAAYLRRSQKHILRLLPSEEGLHGVLPGQIQLLMGPGNNVVVALPVQFPHNGGAHHAPVTGYIDFCVFVHHFAASAIAFSCFARARSCLAMISTS